MKTIYVRENHVNVIWQCPDCKEYYTQPKTMGNSLNDAPECECDVIFTLTAMKKLYSYNKNFVFKLGSITGKNIKGYYGRIYRISGEDSIVSVCEGVFFVDSKLIGVTPELVIFILQIQDQYKNK